MKKVLFVLSRIPWPIDSGMKGMLSYWCELLNGKLDTEVFLFFVGKSEEEINPAVIPDFIKGYEVGTKIRTFEKLNNLFFKTLFASWPMQCSINYNKKNVQKLTNYVERIKPDVVVYDMVRTMNYRKCAKEYKNIMYLGDLLSNRYELQLKTKSYTNILGQAKGDDFISKISKSKFLSKIALKIEKKKTYKAEIKCAKVFDKIAFIAEKENEIYISRTGANNSYVIPIGVDYDFFSEDVGKINSGVNSLVFLGNMDYEPNYLSVINICEQILPNLKTNYIMNFVGFAPEELSEKYKKENIVFTGRVEDMREIVQKSKIFLAPIAYGTGIKTKIIEAFAMKKCVVTNSIGAENIDASNGKDFFVEDDNTKIAELVDSLLEDDLTIFKVGENARRLAKDKYTYDKVEKALKMVLFEE